jgi:single-strand DNA-binding protein
MPSYNHVVLMGNVTRDPQVTQLPSQTVVAKFGLAVNRKFRTQSGEELVDTCFVDCEAFGKQGEVIARYCPKGRPLFVQGRLKYDAWEDKHGGKRSKLLLVVERFQFIGDRQRTAAVRGTPPVMTRPAR